MHNAQMVGCLMVEGNARFEMASIGLEDFQSKIVIKRRALLNSFLDLFCKIHFVGTLCVLIAGFI